MMMAFDWLVASRGVQVEGRLAEGIENYDETERHSAPWSKVKQKRQRVKMDTIPMYRGTMANGKIAKCPRHCNCNGWATAVAGDDSIAWMGS